MAEFLATPLAFHLQSLLGMVVILALAWLLSENRRAFPVRIVIGGLAMQAGLAMLLLKVPAARDALFALNGAVDALTGATRAGTSFVFGFVGGGAPPFTVTNPAGLTSFAFGVLPLVIVISALSALLWYWGILPIVINAIAFVLKKLLGIGGAVGLGSGATIFLGMVEAPLLIKPYLPQITRSELFILLTVGLASVAGTVFVLYATILRPVLPGALGHILVASMMSLPGAIAVAKIMIPGEASTETAEASDVQYRSSMDAIARGTEDGLKIYLQIVAMLIVILALVALAELDPEEPAARLGRAADPGAHLRLAVRARRLAVRRALARDTRRRKPDGDQGRPERAHRLSRPVGVAEGFARSASDADHGLRHVRFRQSRQRRHHDRGDERADAGQARRDRSPCHAGAGIRRHGERSHRFDDRAAADLGLIPSSHRHVAMRRTDQWVFDR